MIADILAGNKVDAAAYNKVRRRTEEICKPLKTEDYVVQPIVDVSPPKWHIGHTTWFFETFVLKPYLEGYEEFDPSYPFVFNSYYETLGARVIRTDRGNLSRPSVEDIYKYRAHADRAMNELLARPVSAELNDIICLGLNHEEQHQELLYTDIKYILGHNPLFPAYTDKALPAVKQRVNELITIPEGIYEIGYAGEGFCFDNELGRHKAFLREFNIATEPVTNREYLEFIEAGGYSDFRFWHSEGWEWVKTNDINAPMYWHMIDGNWCQYTLSGLEELNLDELVCHVSYYEAAAYAAWRGMRLPTEQEWEVASTQLNWGRRWEWTESAYLPYPGFKKAPGAIGEYNGKFMVNQMVLRGASDVTSPGHSRHTYRNFFHAHLRWQYTGIRLAQ
jgi:ergothioneine biosynthesis protein EgtB